jgi:hypothetical protein
MSLRTPWLALVALPIIVSSACAQKKDAIELLPAQTLACLELRQPTRLAREIALLVQGSALDDLPRRLAKIRAQAGQQNDRLSYRRREELTVLNVFLCREMLDEAGRVGGGFVAMTDFGKDNLPNVVGVLQNGTSNMPGIFLSAFSTSSMVHLVGEVEGVPLFREKMRMYNLPPAGPGEAPQFQERDSGPLVGRLPGAIVFGSSVDSCKDVIRRAKGKRSAEASLNNLRAFKDSAALREKPGLFAYVDVAALQGKFDEAIQKSDRGAARFERGFQAILGKDAVRNLTLSLTLHNGALEGRIRCEVNAKSESPLLGLLPDRTAPREMLHFAPRDALLALASGFDDHEKRWKTLLKYLDAMYDLDGRAGDNRPSRAVAEMEKKLNFHIDKDVLAHLTGTGFVIAKDWRHKPAQGVLLLQAPDAESATKLEKDGLPRLFSLGSDEVYTVMEEEVGGWRIKTMKNWVGVKGFLPAVHFGRQGAVVVVGFDAERVADALIAGGKKAGLLGEAKVAEAVKEIDDKSVAVGVLSSSQAALDLLAALNRPPARMGRPPAPGLPPQPVEQPEDKPLEESKAVQVFRKASEPLVFGLHRKPESLVLEMRPLSLRRMTPLFLDAWIETLLKPVGVGEGTPLPQGERIKR